MVGFVAVGGGVGGCDLSTEGNSVLCCSGKDWDWDNEEEGKTPRDTQPQQTEESCVREQIQEHRETGTVGIGS